jgi:hypothetical protein
MSKCQMNKYKTGGRCGGSQGSSSDGYKPAEYTAYLTKRQEQDRLFNGIQQETTIVERKPESKPDPKTNRKNDIDLILSGE